MNQRIEIAKKQNLNWQGMLIQEAQTNIKQIIRDLIIGKSFAEVRTRIAKEIRNVVKDLESNDLKRITKGSLERFANKLIGQCLVDIGVPMNTMLIYYGMLKSGVSIPNIAKQVNKSISIEKGTGRAYDIGQAGQMYSKDYMKQVKSAFRRIIESEPMYDEHVSLRNIAEMTVRYEKTMGSIEELKAKGVNLVQSSRHANCSKRCERWQGGYYTLDDTYQIVDGIQFQPLKNATDQYYTTKKGKVYKNGHITGYNCRHYLVAYKTGRTQPMGSAETVAKERAIDSKMRQYERQIRLWKETALIYKGVDKEEYQMASQRASAYNEKYMNFAKANHRVFYPSRTDVF